MSKTLAGRIEAARKAAGMNQSELARALKVTPQTVQQWEKGGGMRHKRVQQVAKVLGVTPESLLFGEQASPAHHAALPNPSQSPALDPAILAAALDWLDFEGRPSTAFRLFGRGAQPAAAHSLRHDTVRRWSAIPCSRQGTDRSR